MNLLKNLENFQIAEVFDGVCSDCQALLKSRLLSLSNTNNPDKMMQEVLKVPHFFFFFLFIKLPNFFLENFSFFLTLYAYVVGAAIWASSWTGERQSTKMRIKYLEAALSQDIQYFDSQVRTSDIFLAIKTDAALVQDAISEKLGRFIHYLATFVTGFVVGFTAVWQLALVTLAIVPLIAVIGGIHTITLAKLSNKSQGAMSQAGNIVEQTIVQIQIVFAFVGESKALQAYSGALKIAQKLGYKSGSAKGLGLGGTYFVVLLLLCSSFGFWIFFVFGRLLFQCFVWGFNPILNRMLSIRYDFSSSTALLFKQMISMICE